MALSRPAVRSRPAPFNMEPLQLSKESETIIKSILHVDSIDEIINMDYKTNEYESPFRRKLNKDIDRILFPWHERLRMAISKKLYSWGLISQKKIKIHDRYEILLNENKKRNRKSH